MRTRRKKSDIFKGGSIPHCRLCDAPLGEANWNQHAKFTSGALACNYTCRSCQTRERYENLARPSDVDRAATAEEKADRRESGLCIGCEVPLTSENWTWHPDAPKTRSAKTYKCKQCVLAYNREFFRNSEWSWLYTSINRANLKLKQFGLLTIEGMRAKWNGKCHWCDQALSTCSGKMKRGDRRTVMNAVTLDHILSCLRGGTNTDPNAVWACWSCNLSKKQSTVEEWIGGMERILRKHRPASVALYSLPACEIPDCLPVEL